MTLNVEHELLAVFFAPEHEFLAKLLIAIRRKHNINCRFLARLQSTRRREHLEELNFLLLFSISVSFARRCISIRVHKPPFTRHFFLVLDAKLNRLSRVDEHSGEVQIIAAQAEFGLRQVSNEVNHVGWTVLDINRNHEVSAAKALLLT